MRMGTATIKRLSARTKETRSAYLLAGFLCDGLEGRFFWSMDGFLFGLCFLPEVDLFLVVLLFESNLNFALVFLLTLWGFFFRRGGVPALELDLLFGLFPRSLLALRLAGVDLDQCCDIVPGAHILRVCTRAVLSSVY